MDTTFAAILLAGGSGKRMGMSTPKQFLELEGKPVAAYSFDVLLSIPAIQEIVVVCDPSYHYLFTSSQKKISFALPGSERQDSVRNGFKEISKSSKFVLIHDAARPFIVKKEVEELMLIGAKVQAATLASPVKSTIKQAGSDRIVQATLPRHLLWEIHTPQLLSYDLLQKGLAKVLQENISVTDDVALAEIQGHPVELVASSPSNLKITTPFDLAIAKTFLQASAL